MTESTETISLFPLSIVLFPGSFIPLHIYEPRYRQLVHSTYSQGKYFGVNLVEKTEMCAAGCTARVVEILHTYEDGRMDIVVAGGRRYRVSRINDIDTPCLNAVVEYFDDTPSTSVDERLFDECVTLYNKIVDVVFKGVGELVLQNASAHNATFSFVMAQKAGLKLQQKQSLLESQSESERLHLLAQHMRELIPTLDEVKQAQSIVACDGYFVR